MTESGFAAWTRRRFLRQAGGFAAATFLAPGLALHPADSRAAPTGPARGASLQPLPAPSSPLIDGVAAVCQRLSAGGWRDLLLAVSGNGLDIAGNDLAAALARPLGRIDRTAPGFEDFALEGVRGIEPGSPGRSLLFHALASPNVFRDGAGNDLTAFPTPADIEAVENYVYGANPPSLDDLRLRAGGAPLGIVTFALEYRPGRDTVHGKHADCCFARTGHARLGTSEAIYDARRREFLPAKADDPFAFPVQPARYAPFVAAQLPADPGRFGPMRATADDRDLLFWMPLHKLFSGPECLRGLDLEVTLATGHVNEKLRRFHLRMNNAGFATGWDEPHLSRFPFVVADEALASFSTDPSHGAGWVMPLPHPLVEPAMLDGQPLTFYYSTELAADPESIYFSSLQLLEAPPFSPLGPGRTQSLPENIPVADDPIPGYLTTIGPDIGRSTPEYLNVRHKIGEDGAEVNLNDEPDLREWLGGGGYWARHYLDYAGDGWVAARCPQLDAEIPARVPAYSTVCPPSFYPYTSQRELTEWAERDAPEELRDGIWAIPPRPLSDRRMAANISLPAGFDIDDTTVTAIVSLPQDGVPQQSGTPATRVRRHLHLPDSAAGLFDPGWEVSQDRTADNKFFLTSYGLGTPFIEDAKLCAMLSTFWPGVSPDSAREFQPDKRVEDDFQGWPSVSPMTDEELGIVEADGAGYFPWDGVRGPYLETVDGLEVVNFPDVFHTDYLETVDGFTASLTARVDQEEYQARVLAMAQVYWALGIRFADYGEQFGIAEALDRFQAAKGEWSVLSFRAPGAGDAAELAAAEEAVGQRFAGGPRYRFHLFRWNGEQHKPADIRRVLVGIADQVVAYSDLDTLLLARDGGWELVQPPR